MDLKKLIYVCRIYTKSIKRGTNIILNKAYTYTKIQHMPRVSFRCEALDLVLLEQVFHKWIHYKELISDGLEVVYHPRGDVITH
jgi:hypothetical protein